MLCLTYLATSRKKVAVKTAAKLLPYAVYSDNNEIDLDSTLVKFKMDLNQMAILILSGQKITTQLIEDYQIMENLNIELVQGWIDEAGAENLGKKGVIDGIVKKFHAYLSENAETWAQSEAKAKVRAENRRANIYKAYEQLGKLIAPEPTVVMSVLLISGVAPAEIGDETKAIEIEIEHMVTEKILGRKRGPTGGLGVAKDSHGKATKIAGELAFEPFTRQGKSPPA